MPQLAIYIDDDLSKKLNKATKASGKSRSKWVADLIKAKLEDEWPQGFFESKLNEKDLGLLRESVLEMENEILRRRRNRRGDAL